MRNYRYKDHIDSYCYSYILLILYIIWFQGEKCRRNLRLRCGYPAAGSHFTIRISLYDSKDIKGYCAGGLVESYASCFANLKYSNPSSLRCLVHILPQRSHNQSHTERTAFTLPGYGLNHSTGLTSIIDCSFGCIHLL
jgi:hypothetical protein